MLGDIKNTEWQQNNTDYTLTGNVQFVSWVEGHTNGTELEDIRPYLSHDCFLSS